MSRYESSNHIAKNLPAMVYILVVGTTCWLPAACSCSARFKQASTILAPCALFVLAQAFITAAKGKMLGSNSPTGTCCNLRVMRSNHSRFLDLGDVLVVPVAATDEVVTVLVLQEVSVTSR